MDFASTDVKIPFGHCKKPNLVPWPIAKQSQEKSALIEPWNQHVSVHVHLLHFDSCDVLFEYDRLQYCLIPWASLRIKTCQLVICELSYAKTPCYPCLNHLRIGFNQNPTTPDIQASSQPHQLTNYAAWSCRFNFYPFVNSNQMCQRKLEKRVHPGRNQRR